ncbi:Uncharacterised protein [Citrobacter werkmanii]|nr:Uncharacterised protein [Citrobacter werkmanii]
MYGQTFSPHKVHIYQKIKRRAFFAPILSPNHMQGLLVFAEINLGTKHIS